MEYIFEFEPFVSSIFSKSYKDWDYMFLSVQRGHLSGRKPDLSEKLVPGAVINKTVHGRFSLKRNLLQMSLLDIS